MANSNNVKLRTVEQRPLAYEELDGNFSELISVIDDFNQFSLESPKFNQETLWSISKLLLEKQLYFDPGVEDVFTISGDRLEVSASTTLFNSPLYTIKDNKVNIECGGLQNGGIRVAVKGYAADGSQVTGSTDTDFVVNGSNRSFVASPTYAPVSNNESSLEIAFTDIGRTKADFYTISIQSSGLGVLDFTSIIVRG